MKNFNHNSNSSNKGNRNLAILSVGAFLITIITTSASLMIYRNSGDIYLDRSRPGYLPDETEVTAEPENTTGFSFSENGGLNAEELDQYLSELKKLNDCLLKFDDAYSPSPLSDESLGIPSELKEQ